jgi:hypothetical protein
MTHQRRTSRLTKDGQSFSSIRSTLIWWLISSGAYTRASLKILRLPLLFSRYLSPTAPTAVTGLLSSDRRLPGDCPRRYRLRGRRPVGSRHCPATSRGTLIGFCQRTDPIRNRRFEIHLSPAVSELRTGGFGATRILGLRDVMNSPLTRRLIRAVSSGSSDRSPDERTKPLRI